MILLTLIRTNLLIIEYLKIQGFQELQLQNPLNESKSILRQLHIAHRIDSQRVESKAEFEAKAETVAGGDLYSLLLGIPVV